MVYLSLSLSDTSLLGTISPFFVKKRSRKLYLSGNIAGNGMRRMGIARVLSHQPFHVASLYPIVTNQEFQSLLIYCTRQYTLRASVLQRSMIVFDSEDYFGGFQFEKDDKYMKMNLNKKLDELSGRTVRAYRRRPICLDSEDDSDDIVIVKEKVRHKSSSRSERQNSSQRQFNRELIHEPNSYSRGPSPLSGPAPLNSPRREFSREPFYRSRREFSRSPGREPHNTLRRGISRSPGQEQYYSSQEFRFSPSRDSHISSPRQFRQSPGREPHNSLRRGISRSPGHGPYYSSRRELSRSPSRDSQISSPRQFRQSTGREPHNSLQRECSRSPGHVPYYSSRSRSPSRDSHISSRVEFRQSLMSQNSGQFTSAQLDETAAAGASKSEDFQESMYDLLETVQFPVPPPAIFRRRGEPGNSPLRDPQFTARGERGPLYESRDNGPRGSELSRDTRGRFPVGTRAPECASFERRDSLYGSREDRNLYNEKRDNQLQSPLGTRDLGPSTSIVNPERNVFATSNFAAGASTKRSFEQALPQDFQSGMYIFCLISPPPD